MYSPPTINPKTGLEKRAVVPIVNTTMETNQKKECHYFAPRGTKLQSTATPLTLVKNTH